MQEKGAAPERQAIARLSPDRLVSGFSRSRIWAGLGLSAAIHVAVLGVTSVGYLHGVIDPQWKAEQDAKREAEKKARAEAKLEAARGAQSAAPAVEGEEASDAATPDSAKPEGARPDAKRGESGASSEDERLMKERADTPVVKAITEAAPPGDIPDDPGLGLSIEETNSE